MSKVKSIKYQVQGELMQKLAIGSSRHEAKTASADGKSPYIHSWNTYNDYVKHSTAFGEWVKENFGEKKIENMKDYVPDYLRHRIAKGLAPHTVHLDASAIAKLYGCSHSDFGVELPERKRDKITRSRGEVKDFNEKKHSNLVAFCKGTGLRRHELLALKKEDVYTEGSKVFVHVKSGKGGKSRAVPVVDEYKKIVLKMAEECKSDNEKIFKKGDIPIRTPTHKYRAAYANIQYKKLARPKQDIPKDERYICRKDRKGVVYDRVAMKAVSQMLGHERVTVIAQSYLY